MQQHKKNRKTIRFEWLQADGSGGSCGIYLPVNFEIQDAGTLYRYVLDNCFSGLHPDSFPIKILKIESEAFPELYPDSFSTKPESDDDKQ